MAAGTVTDATTVADVTTTGCDDPQFSLVVSTIGRPSTFGRLLASLAEESRDGPTFELIVVDQDPEQRSLEILESEPWPFPWRHLTSGRGASVGRNVGLAVARAEIVGFPDDDAWYSGSTLAGVRAIFDALPGIAGVGGRLVTGEGRSNMLRWLKKPTWVTRLSYHRTAIGPTMFYRRSALSTVGAFDENMGPGAPGWYGAAEDSDLVIRVLDSGGNIRYIPTLVVYHDPLSSDMAGGMPQKMLLYGVAQGYFWRKHHYPMWFVSWLLLRKLVKVIICVVCGRLDEARLDIRWSYGAVSGLTGREPRAFRGSSRAQ